MEWIIYSLFVIILISIIEDNRCDKKYKETLNRAMEYRRKKYLKELKDGEK